MKRNFDSKIRKVGNSYVVTIPKELIDRFKLDEKESLALTINLEESK